MDMIGKTRRLHARDKLSERKIARRTEPSRNTVPKWLRAPRRRRSTGAIRAPTSSIRLRKRSSRR